MVTWAANAASQRGLAVAAGLAADRVLGEPAPSWHPVGAYGRMMAALEVSAYADSRGRGLGYALVGVAAGAVVGAAAQVVAGSMIPRPGRALAVASATYVVVAGRGLNNAAAEVADALRLGDTEAARSALPALVGRDPAGLDETEMARAAVESVAENTVDAVVAPALWSLALGAPGALAYRALNTLDSMVGHRCPRYQHFGWASARADDVASWLPARLTAVLVAAVRPAKAPAVWRAVRRQAPAHPSPNAGVAEAAFAAALGVTLGGVNAYGGRIEVRPRLGVGPAPGLADVARARALSRDVAAALGVACATPAAALRWRRRP
jgi:adenosylcobinamide-phosphate synthase